MGAILNWAGNLQYSTENIHSPGSIDEVRTLCQKLPKARVMGTRHSFNTIGDSKHHLISLASLPRVMELDKARHLVTVSAGTRYGELAVYLHENGFALHNLGSLPHISVAGACVSATHGSGIKNGILATAVTAIELVTANGQVQKLSREKDGELFNGCIVNLGALGVITRLTLKVEPTYAVRQNVFENLPIAELLMNADLILNMGYSVSLFTDWKTTSINQWWVKDRLEDGTYYVEYPRNPIGATTAKGNLHPIAGMPVENCTEQMGIPGPWHERLPHFRMEFTPSSGEELQSEYFVPLPHALRAIMNINQIRHLISPYILISELRTIAADELWMSPFYKQACLAIHFTWKQNWPEVKKLLPVIESALAPLEVRPHWGKLFTISPKVIRSRYTRLKDFQDLVKEFDPSGKFTNEFLETVIFS